MKRKKRWGRYKHGLFSGWDEYRYGTPKPVKLAPIFRGDRRKWMVDECIAILRRGRKSPFEYEGALRAGLRSDLCLKGYGWLRADLEAASLIEEALRLIGAKRPTWLEGQWQYTLDHDTCSHCLGPISPEDQARGFRYCSTVCARSAYERLAEYGARHQNAVAQQAHIVLKTIEAPVMECQHCHKPFQRHDWKSGRKSKTGRNKYCSQECQHAARKTLTERECPVCGTSFMPRAATQACCSKACSYQHLSRQWASKKIERKAVVEATCSWCSKPFKAKRSDAQYCSRKCAREHRDYSTGVRQPRRLTPPVFDWVFHLAA